MKVHKMWQTITSGTNYSNHCNLLSRRFQSTHCYFGAIGAFKVSARRENISISISLRSTLTLGITLQALKLQCCINGCAGNDNLSTHGSQPQLCQAQTQCRPNSTTSSHSLSHDSRLNPQFRLPRAAMNPSSSDACAQLQEAQSSISSRR